MNQDVSTWLFKETIYLRLLISAVAKSVGFSEQEWQELCASARLEAEREYLDCKHKAGEL